MTGFVLGPNQTKWIEALESGNYKQGKSVLHQENGAMCCLGVAAHIFAEENRPEKIVPRLVEGEAKGCYYYQGEATEAPMYVMETIALMDPIANSSNRLLPPLVVLNDDKDWSFAQIAQHLRKNAQFYFKESK